MPDLGADPAAGSAEGVGEIARSFRAYAGASERNARRAARAVDTLANTGADAVEAARSDIAVLRAKYAAEGDASSRVAGILESYADAMRDLRRRAESMREEVERAWASLGDRRAAALDGGLESLQGWPFPWDEVMPAWLYPGDPARLQQWQAAIEEFEQARAAYRRLAVERAELDHRTRDRLREVPLFAELTDRWRLRGGGADAIADVWAGDTTDITPQGLTAIGDAGLVRRLWDALSEEQQRDLIAAGPALLGSLAGLPPWARVAASRLNAKARAAEVRRILASEPHPFSPRAGHELDKLRAELHYLDQVVEGRVQVYFYDHMTDSIMEMIGEPGPTTAEINTYVPGTYTSALSVYRGEVQQVGRWLSESSGGSIVTFVWKVGRFPGENEYTGIASFARIGEANDEGIALDKGQEIAAFERELDVAVGDVDADRNGIGFSWGLTGITASEVAGARYDGVFSLAGAGMPKDWEPSPTTNYEHFSYTDALTTAQSLGVVWEGRNPGTHAAFTPHLFSDSADWVLPIHPPSSGFGHSVEQPEPFLLPGNWTGIDTHNLIASNDPLNWPALERVRGSLTN